MKKIEHLLCGIVYTLSSLPPEPLFCNMDKQPHFSSSVSEEQIVALLSTLRVEQTPEADFEARFLEEFHERVAREAVCCPARRHLLAHLLQLLDNVGRGRFAFGASAFGFGALALCYALFPGAQSGVETAAAVAPGKNEAPLLIPALSHDLADCTSIRVEPVQSVFEVGGVTITRGANTTVIEVPHSYVPAQRGSEAGKAANRVLLPSSAVRYAF